MAGDDDFDDDGGKENAGAPPGGRRAIATTPIVIQHYRILTLVFVVFQPHRRYAVKWAVLLSVSLFFLSHFFFVPFFPLSTGVR